MYTVIKNNVNHYKFNNFELDSNQVPRLSYSTNKEKKERR